MSKTVYVDVTCEKCLKVRRANKYCHGRLCRNCAQKEQGALLRGVLRKRKKDLTGVVFGQLTAIKPSMTKSKNASWICKCTCGKEINVATCKLLHDGQHSCGCHKLTQEGLSKTRTYKSWGCMVRRCTLESSNRWHIYGGRGIKVCDRWKNSFLDFLEDMGERPKGTSLDRIDTDGNYCPENCRWATPKEQARNTRKNRLIKAFGKAQSSAAWSEETGIGRGTIEWRLDRGWTPKEALTLSVDQKEKRKKVVSL